MDYFGNYVMRMPGKMRWKYYFIIMVKIFCSSNFANFALHYDSGHVSDLASSLGARILLLLMKVERDTDPQTQPFLHKCPYVPYGRLILITSLTGYNFNQHTKRIKKNRPTLSQTPIRNLFFLTLMTAPFTMLL